MSSARCTPYAAIPLLVLSCIALAVNSVIYHYPGNNYFPTNAIFVAFNLMMLYVGLVLQLGRTHSATLRAKELCIFFLVMSLLALATNATQLTPYPPIDKHIVSLESSLHINLKAILIWTNTHPELKYFLGFLYDTLPYQMCYLPLLFIVLMQRDVLYEYYFLLLFSALLGFTCYYFFPTTAPASIIDSPYFSLPQQATHLKFMQIHQHIQPSTLEGGLVAFPSFHVIWAWLCVHMLRKWRMALVALLPINLLLAASCILLGWHYPEDLVGSVIVIILSHSTYHLIQRRTQPLSYHPELTASSLIT